ncbi:TonB-dependent receptor, partial [Undibacterium sp.]|uniref:TonB-dependent receptor n=1 Tax=Undibacterium sp. TaxID=1914977 RepID=UPI002C7AB805
MTNQKKFRLSKLAFSLALALATVPALAQNTTSGIGGLVTGADGAPLSGAKVTIVHTESGSVNNTVTDAKGRYLARGLRVGGPYTITITQNGVTEKRENVYVQLAETANLDATLGASAVQTVTVSGNAGQSQIFSKTNMGAGTNIGSRELNALGSIKRNLADYARIDPRISQTDKERGELSVAGQNPRFNSITIDGVSISDTFGLEANGLPTAKQPIAIDAIQSVQVNVSNYDVTQKGYTGANINAVTKSGTNTFKGSTYVVYRDDKLSGQKYNSTAGTFYDPAPFTEVTKGVTFGGPLIKDKLFFFTSLEDMTSTRSAPAYGPLGSSQTNVGITPSSIASAQAIANSKYGINIGTSDVPAGTKLSVKDRLLRLDWNINDDHRASLRYDKTEQKEPIFAGFSASGVSLNSEWYAQNKAIEATVAQLFSDWTPNFSTEVKLSSRKTDSVPVNNSNMPVVGLQFSGALPPGTPSSVSSGNRYLNFGTEASRQLNVLNTKTADAYFGANWLLGQHEVKFGADYSKNDIYNAFLQNVNGNYTFNCSNGTYSFGTIDCAKATAAQVEAAVLENFSRGRPSAYQVQVAAPGYKLSDAFATFTLKNYGAFVQDTWKATPQLTLMYGVRLDTPKTDGRPVANAAAAAPVVHGNPLTGARASGGFGLDNTVTIDGNNLVQPRVGFNYAFDASRPTQIRGGVGLFQGAAANVWLANPFQNAGLATRIVGCGINGFAACSTDGLYNPDPNKQQTNFTGAIPAANVDFLAPDMAQPSIWKSNLAFEHALPNGLVLSAEYLYLKTKDGIYYQHLNLGDPTKTGSDGRPLYYTPQGYDTNCWSATGSLSASGACTGSRSRALSNPNFNNVLVASKTDKGGGSIATLSLSSPMSKGFGWSVNYTYSDATEVSPLSSSVSNSNWQSRASFNPNENVAGNSASLVKDRINASLIWEKAFYGNYKTSFGVFYEGRTGKPYSWTFYNDANGDGVFGNDLM